MANKRRTAKVATKAVVKSTDEQSEVATEEEIKTAEPEESAAAAWTQDQIVEALEQLDADNDDHWTEEGLPLMEAVEALVGTSEISREDVEAAKPGFKRPEASAPTPEEPTVAGDGDSPAEVVDDGAPVEDSQKTAAPPLSGWWLRYVDKLPTNVRIIKASTQTEAARILGDMFEFVVKNGSDPKIVKKLVALVEENKYGLLSQSSAMRGVPGLQVDAGHRLASAYTAVAAVAIDTNIVADEAQFLKYWRRFDQNAVTDFLTTLQKMQKGRKRKS